MSEPATVFSRLCAWLTSREVKFEVLHHAAVFTSAEAAAVRGTPLASGAKALVCLADGTVQMFVLPADRKLDGKLARKLGGWKGLRFASREEVEALTGLAPGSIPPFGSLFGMPTWCDPALGAHDRINFNAGDHTVSISLAFADYLLAEGPRQETISSQ